MQKKISKYHFAICILLSCIREASWYRTKLQMIKSAVCYGSTILLADFLGQINHAHKSGPTLSIVWRPLNDDSDDYGDALLSISDYTVVHISLVEEVWWNASVSVERQSHQPDSESPVADADGCQCSFVRCLGQATLHVIVLLISHKMCIKTSDVHKTSFSRPRPWSWGPQQWWVHDRKVASSTPSHSATK